MGSADDDLTRRSFTGLAGAGLVGLAASCAPKAPSATSGETGAAAGEGGATCEETRSDIEGPYYRNDLPERDDLDTLGEKGTRLTITGVVQGADCAPIAGARIDFWQADVAGAYDLKSSAANYYGYQVVDNKGRYALNTLVPGRYLNGAQYRPAHIHVKVFVDGVEKLTTQLYFEGDPYNKVDAWWSAETTLALHDDGSGGKIASFDITVS
jgi:protocatechuate 3,4-dioxygenase beta subunit